MTEFHQAAAAVYLAAGIAALLGIVMPSSRLSRGAIGALVLGAVLQGIGFATLHRQAAPPSLTDLGSVGALVAWMAVLCLVLFAWRMRLSSLAAAIGFVAFLFVFASLASYSEGGTVSQTEAGGWSHLHVLLASGGLALLGVAGLAGCFYLLQHRRLKSKRSLGSRLPGPSLEALDQINVISLAVGFPLLTLGLITGMLWQHSVSGAFWTGSPHETWMLVAWAIYFGLVSTRFIWHQGARNAAATAVAGFAFLAFAVVGVGILH